mgnify:CR=1 FL=1
MYQALYRKWRPKTFSDVVGQEHVTETLQRQVAEGRLSHAYLFTGTRGTGKTTCAKILAKAVNCEHPENGNPCNKCQSCLGIESGGFLDVMELDAASNNGVDHVRALRDEAIYSPAQVKKRVYIIDEVHMLSIAAFNALLKILEEPPEHLMFILATTELHKVPATILSRCQRFAFRRIVPEDIVGRLNYIAYQESIELEPDAASFLARLADGGLRRGAVPDAPALRHHLPDPAARNRQQKVDPGGDAPTPFLGAFHLLPAPRAFLHRFVADTAGFSSPKRHRYFTKSLQKSPPRRRRSPARFFQESTGPGPGPCR